jgi:hypothetical protein
MVVEEWEVVEKEVEEREVWEREVEEVEVGEWKGRVFPLHHWWCRGPGPV